MTEQEGVIKFQLQFSAAPPVPVDWLYDITSWRKILYDKHLIGQDPNRYGGYGYGNISQRVEPFDAPAGRRRFIISGTQTGEMAELGPEHYALVVECHPQQNLVVAQGPIRPSSETLTHGVLYDLDDSLRFVMHVHSPDIWRNARSLAIPLTDESVAYGSPQMAEEVLRLFRDTSARDLHIFAMAGHEDGVVAFGQTAEEAGIVLLTYLAELQPEG